MNSSFDWRQLVEVAFLPDNVAILVFLPLAVFYTAWALRIARRNDALIARLRRDPDLARTHHRTIYPHDPSWPETVPVWPHLLKREFLAAIVVTVLMLAWALLVDAPLEEPADPNVTTNPSKAPWYFVGLQEMLVYFDPWFAGVVLPGLIVTGLMLLPYLDRNPLGNGYFTLAQRPFAVVTFLVGFFGLWVLAICVGAFLRGPGWMLFLPGETWDARRVVDARTVDLHEIFGVEGTLPIALFGAGVMALYAIMLGGLTHHRLSRGPRPLSHQLGRTRYLILHAYWFALWLLPLKVFLRLAFDVGALWVTPWFEL